ncbi:oxidative damage protection protein [Allofrancisella guangzhouensis]|uniref:Probable Fe(2+)-trafficking protein n=1 Tax=Allofrancisella guangzhouensis TaxID=594679 RepID=A0A0A8E608_9GAMM|nr:oxidative damage protection protein [Allofrancisella guangzhouensis]AJC49414.1 iron transporter [Allofrancisella guangzhouensis]MBK2026704.1 oxidative damage protection protein [Allofrancisella guangzhouensis]MBK2043954.1 oxidative damage protection protein [Allofrancisella guangzhouensis]MBK2046216.1 oxidative damage protection protein [Allofrancisella guangzhouensis]
MTKVLCKKYNQELDAIPYKPLPGELGEKIQAAISNKAWQDWLAHQTILINEYRLNLIEPKAKEFLQKEMHKFLFENKE